MKYLAVLFSVISFALAAQDLLGKDECTYGPSYWCSQISKAKKCGAVQYCMQTVWKNQIIKPKDTMQCNLCKIGIDEVRAMLKKNGTEEELKKYLPEVCKVIPSPDMKAKCESDVAQYLPIILDFLKSSMTTEKICALMSLCTGFEDTVQHKAVSHDVKVNTADVCEDCTRFFIDVQNMIISNETQKQIEDLLKQTLCSQLGPVQGMCDFVVDEYIPQILQYLGQTVDPQTTCRIIGFCSNGDIFTAFRIRMKLIKLFKQFNQKSIGGQVECDACKAVMADVQNLDRDATIQDKIKDFVKTELCKRLGELQNECTNLVDTYAPIFFELMANELDPETVCSFIGFCRASLGKTRKQSVDIISLVPATPIKAVKPVKTSGAFCEVCKFVMAYLDTTLAKNSTKQQIEAALDEVCSRLSGDLSTECTAFINLYAPVIIDLLEQELDPTVICDKIGLCTPLKLHKKSGIKASVECVVCEYAMSEIEKLISKNKSRAAIEQALDKVCDLMPSTISAECTSFVQKYGPMIINILISEGDPKRVCTLIKLCTSTVKKTLPRPFVSGILLRGEPIFNKKSGIKASVECVVCEYAMSEIEKLISKNKSRAAIEQALDKVCDLMPSTISAECTSFVQKYGPMIINILISEGDPKKVCTLIKLCTSTVKKTLPRPFVSGILLRGESIFNKKSGTKSRAECVICKYIMSEIDTLIKQNKSEAAIEQAMDKVCDLLPSTISAECISIIKQYGPMIIQLLINNVKPEEVCTEIKLCTSTVKKTLLRGEPIFNKKSGMKASVECVVCEYAMTEIEKLISGNKSQAAIEQALDKVCDLFPSSISAECISFVKQYGPAIIHLLIMEVRPEEVCTALQLCTSTVKKTLPKSAVSGILLRGEPIFNKRKPVKNSETCLVCETVLNYVVEALKENKTVAAIMSLLKKACTELPSSMSDECQGLVIAFGPEIVKMLQQDLDPKQVCTELGICTSTKINRKQHKEEIKNVLLEHQQILDSKLYFRPAMNNLGQKKCSYGPSYWCDSMKNAKECGMVEHCKAHEWGKNKA